MKVKHLYLLGDPHLGRRFRTGVPLHRIGDREAIQWKTFVDELNARPEGVDLHINLGDLFDSRVVPPEVVLQAAHEYRRVAAKNSDVTYVVLRGNHDVSRDAEKASSFDLFSAIVADVPNIHVVTDTPLVVDGYGFVAYHPFEDTADVVRKLPDGLKAVFGHWDVVAVNNKSNLIPTSVLMEKGITTAYTGHDHLRRDLNLDGVDVHVVGSMLPMSHAEDPEGRLYVTVTLDELDGMDVKDKHVRVKLAEGQEPPVDLDCLSLTVMRMVEDDVNLAADTSEFNGIDMRAMLATALEGLECRERLLEIFQEESSKDD